MTIHGSWQLKRLQTTVVYRSGKTCQNKKENVKKEEFEKDVKEIIFFEKIRSSTEGIDNSNEAINDCGIPRENFFQMKGSFNCHEGSNIRISFNFKRKHKTKVKSVQLGYLLKPSSFVVQKAAAPKNGVKFCQWSIGALRCSLATTTGDVARLRVCVVGGGGV